MYICTHINFSAMKRIQTALIGFAICLLGNSCSDPETPATPKKKTENDLVKEYKIKSISEYQSLVHLNIPEKEKIHHVNKFDEKGRLLTASGFLEDGSIDFISTCTYDKYGNLIEKKSTKESGFFISTDKKYYDTKNRRNQNLHFEDPTDPYLYGNINSFDTLGRLMHSEIFWPTGLRAIEYYKYNGMMMIVNEEFDAYGIFQYRWKYKYDQAENQTEAVQYYRDSTVHSKNIFRYDGNNQLIEQTNYLEGSVAYHATFEYDSKFLMISKTEFSTFGQVAAKYRYVYEYYK